jgi:hypothetical protein
LTGIGLQEVGPLENELRRLGIPPKALYPKLPYNEKDERKYGVKKSVLRREALWNMQKISEGDKKALSMTNQAVGSTNVGAIPFLETIISSEDYKKMPDPFKKIFLLEIMSEPRSDAIKFAELEHEVPPAQMREMYDLLSDLEYAKMKFDEENKLREALGKSKLPERDKKGLLKYLKEGRK